MGAMVTRRIFNRIISQVEKVFCRNNIFLKFYGGITAKTILKELSTVNLPADANVLYIGCGSIPHTLIALAKMKTWKLTGIDKDSEAVEKAKEVVRKLAVSDRVKIEKGDGLEYNVSGYDLIIMDYCVEPREKVLERLWKEADPGTIILYRGPWEVLYIIYGRDKIPEWIPIKRVIYKPSLIKSLLIVKE